MSRPAFALILFATAVPAAATTPEAPAAPARSGTNVKLNPLDKIVCKTDDTTGGRLRMHRVCATVREWQEQAQANREAAELLQRQGQANPH